MNEMNKHTHTHENNKNKMRYDQQHTIRNSKQRLTQWHHYHLLHREQLQPICWSLLVLGVCVCALYTLHDDTKHCTILAHTPTNKQSTENFIKATTTISSATTTPKKLHQPMSSGQLNGLLFPCILLFLFAQFRYLIQQTNKKNAEMGDLIMEQANSTFVFFFVQLFGLWRGWHTNLLLILLHYH